MMSSGCKLLISKPKLLELLEKANQKIKEEDDSKSNKKQKSLNMTLLEYSPPDATGIHNISCIQQTICQSDIDRLIVEKNKDDAMMFFNSTLLHFSFSEFSRKLGLWGNLVGLVILSTLFFTQISSSNAHNYEKSYDNVRNWYIQFDIFAQNIIVAPIHRGYHWSVVFIVYPNSLVSDDVGNHRCAIYHLDSLKRYQLHNTEEIGFLLKQYMLSVWLDERNPRKGQFSESKMRVAIKNIPVVALSEVAQQDNGYDCGTYVSLWFKKLGEQYKDNR